MQLLIRNDKQLRPLLSTRIVPYKQLRSLSSLIVNSYRSLKPIFSIAIV
jgi:hypothetical protein